MWKCEICSCAQKVFVTWCYTSVVYGMAPYPPVCLSQFCVSTKWLIISSCKQRNRWCQSAYQNFHGVTANRNAKYTLDRKISDFWQITRHYLQNCIILMLIQYILQEAQLSLRDRTMCCVSWNLANCHATVQKLRQVRQVLNKVSAVRQNHAVDSAWHLWDKL